MKNKEKNLRGSLADNISYERIAKGITQQELADKLGTGKSSISRIENGRQNITIDYAEAIAEALNMQIAFKLHDAPTLAEENTEYDLKLYDESLVRFKLWRELESCSKLLWVNDKKKHLLPLDLELSDDGIFNWLRARRISSNRALAGNILNSLNLNINDIKGIVDISMGLSLNDSYWITPKGFEGKFADFNLYENNFDEALSLVAYTGAGYHSDEFSTSPELTTNGKLRKAWRNKGKSGIWLYKGGTEDFANAGNEPFSEFYACQIAEAMGLKAVHYELENWKGILASKCRLFTDIDTSYVPISKVITAGGIKVCIEYYKNLGKEYYLALADMLVFDAVIYNTDRHFGNFGLLRDNKSGKIIGTAPIFDNGLSLLCYAMRSDFENLKNYLNTLENPYGKGYDALSLARAVMGKKQKERLRKLIGFKFKESDICNLPSWRIKALEKIVQDRVKELLA